MRGRKGAERRSRQKKRRRWILNSTEATKMRKLVEERGIKEELREKVKEEKVNQEEKGKRDGTNKDKSRERNYGRNKKKKKGTERRRNKKV